MIGVRELKLAIASNNYTKEITDFISFFDDTFNKGEIYHYPTIDRIFIYHDDAFILGFGNKMCWYSTSYFDEIFITNSTNIKVEEAIIIFIVSQYLNIELDSNLIAATIGYSYKSKMNIVGGIKITKEDMLTILS